LPSPPSPISDLVNLLCAQPAPVILLDTCAVLDVPRSLHREIASPALVQRTLRSLQASSATPPELYLAISGQVIQEYTKNLPKVLSDLRDRVSQVSKISNFLLNATDSAQLESTLTSLESNLTDLTDALFKSCLKIAPDHNCASQAAVRLASNMAPAKRGSSNMGDCLVIEHFLELVRQLRAVGFGPPCIFISSNYRDFGAAPNPKASLDIEFASLSVDFMPDIAAAMTQLGF